jgi:hypothetical protein
MTTIAEADEQQGVTTVVTADQLVEEAINKITQAEFSEALRDRLFHNELPADEAGLTAKQVEAIESFLALGESEQGRLKRLWRLGPIDQNDQSTNGGETVATVDISTASLPQLPTKE